jgi:osmotically inducible lipoprotein OsmE
MNGRIYGMSNKTALVFAFSVLGLTGCKTLENASTLMASASNPVVTAASKAGATKQSVLATGVKPTREQPTKKINGTCLDFSLNESKGGTDYYVAVNSEGRVVATGFATCAHAENEGIIHSNQPPEMKSKSNKELLRTILESD